MKHFIKYFSALLLFGLNGVVASHITLSSYENYDRKSPAFGVILSFRWYVSFPKIPARQSFYSALRNRNGCKLDVFI